MTLVFDLPLQTINALFVAGGKDDPKAENIESVDETSQVPTDENESTKIPAENEGEENENKDDDESYFAKRTFTPVWKKDDEEAPSWGFGDEEEEEDETRLNFEG